MDKLRALQYFVAAADGASFSAAARVHGVSVAAVAKLIGALEADLQVQLLERRRSGIALTTAGNTYLESCRPAILQLQNADRQATAGASNVQGTLVVGIQPVIAQEVLTAALPRFNLLYPDIQLDVRHFMRVTDEETRGLDLMLVMGWPANMDGFVRKPMGATTFLIAASPNYWAAHGMPKHPSELQQHNCLCIRSNSRSVMDLWPFRRGEERVTIPVRGWLVTDNEHRDMVRDLAIAGHGVARLLDWHQRPGREVNRGVLVPAFPDWVVDEVPPVNLLYPPSARRNPRARVFVEWVTQVFADIETQRLRPIPATPSPRWMKTPRARASLSV